MYKQSTPSALYFNSTSYSSPQPGRRLIVTGAVHGNETCGTQAIRRLISDIEAGRLTIVAGTVTFVPVCNPLAYQKGERAGNRNLNRKLVPTVEPKEFEDHVANWLCPLLAQHEVLLDLHSFRGAGDAFVLLGPENNDGILEPFKHADVEKSLAMRLGVRRVVDGWLATYALGVARRRSRLDSLGAKADAVQSLSADPQFGVGTTEYMRSVGGAALTLECGSHDDPLAPVVAYRAVLNTMAYLGLVANPDPQPMQSTQSTPTAPTAPTIEALRIYDVIDKEHRDDKFCRDWSSFDALKKGDLIGWRHDGRPVTAAMDGRIIFPDTNATAGEEWFYLTKSSDRI
jgi:predicted deacylase